MKTPRWNSLSVNITLLVLLSISVALAVFTATLLVADRAASIAALDNRMSTLADVIGENSSAALDFTDHEAANSILQALQSEPSLITACLYDTSDTLFASYLHDTKAISCPGKRANDMELPSGFRRIDRAAIHHNEVVGHIRLISAVAEVNARERKMLIVAALLALGALLIGSISGGLMQRWISRPITILSNAMRRVSSSGELNLQVDISGSNEIEELAKGFNSMLGELERRDKLTKQAQRGLHEQARTDTLTGLPNRRYFMERLVQALALAQRENSMISLLYIDLDGFKLVNDSLGHSLGDMLLRQVSIRLRSRIRRSDTLARVGGDEFTVILSGLQAPEDASIAAESLIDALAEPFVVEQNEITVGASIGISFSSLTEPSLDGSDLLRQADSAMYAAKRSGKNRWTLFSNDLRQTARELLTLRNCLRGAVDRGEIYVHYQPEFDVRTGALVRFEALARWTSPELGEVSPARFIPVAEESGLIYEVGSYVMNRACRDAAGWQHLGAGPVQVAVNFSAIQFGAEDVVENIVATLAQTGLDPHLLQIELTESVMAGSMQILADKMQQIRSIGVDLAIDDFGTGYSCLGYLPDLPATALKVDRCFVYDVMRNSEKATTLRSIIELAHSLGMKVIVEGIEEMPQFLTIQAMGADEVQGFLLGRPTGNPEEFLQPTQESVASGMRGVSGEGQNHHRSKHALQLRREKPAQIPTP